MSPSSSGAVVQGRFLVVDGHAYAYRAFYAIRHLNSPSGKATNAIYGFIKMLAKMQAQLQPTHLMIVWDGGLAEERMTLLPEYKAQRAEMPSGLEQQLDEIISYLRAASITSYCEGGVEAGLILNHLVHCMPVIGDLQAAVPARRPCPWPTTCPADPRGDERSTSRRPRPRIAPGRRPVRRRGGCRRSSKSASARA